MHTITRRTSLAVPVTLPLLPLSAYAGPYRTSKSDLPAEEDGGFQEIVDNLKKCTPHIQRTVMRFTRALAEERLNREAEVAS